MHAAMQWLLCVEYSTWKEVCGKSEARGMCIECLGCLGRRCVRDEAGHLGRRPVCSGVIALSPRCAIMWWHSSQGVAHNPAALAEVGQLCGASSGDIKLDLQGLFEELARSSAAAMEAATNHGPHR
jgi:hypothetical protein